MAERLTSSIDQARRFWLWGVVVLIGVIAFLSAPGGAAEKSRAVLHGLCAQTPSHSFSFGGTLLPFDGRMTGIYGGSIITFAWLVVTNRLFAWGNPPYRVVAVLTAEVGLMAVDGFNSLFTDLGIWHPYAPRNEYRLVTGYLTGTVLAVALGWLLGSSMWKMSRPQPGVSSARDLLWPLGCFVPYAAVVVSGWPGFLLPLTWLLMLSAWLTLSVLMLVVVLLLFRYEDQVRSVAQLHVPGAIASALALAIMLSLAGGRFWLERTLDLPMPV